MSRAPFLSLFLIGTAVPCAAAEDLPRQWAGLESFLSTDADGTDVVKVAANLDWRHENVREYVGVRLEQAAYRPLRGKWQEEQRVYLRLADTAGSWAWATNVGTDSHTILGAASLNNDAKWRQEYFLERDIVESRQGLSRRIYYTFAGGAFDVPISEVDSGTVVIGVQEFSGKNVRLHLRANYVRLLDSDLGLTGQLRARYYHSSEPREFDYYSPRYFLELLPVLQMRRTSASGTRYVIAGGYGARRDATSDWKSARYVNAQLTTPGPGRHLAFTLAFTYSNTPVGGGSTYDYTQLNVGISRAF